MSSKGPLVQVQRPFLIAQCNHHYRPAKTEAERIPEIIPGPDAGINTWRPFATPNLQEPDTRLSENSQAAFRRFPCKRPHFHSFRRNRRLYAPRGQCTPPRDCWDSRRGSRSPLATSRGSLSRRILAPNHARIVSVTISKSSLTVVISCLCRAAEAVWRKLLRRVDDCHGD